MLPRKRSHRPPPTDAAPSPLWAGIPAIDVVVVTIAASSPVIIELLQGLEHAGLDLGQQYLPWWTWWWDAFRWDGGWNPWVFAGFPANADPQIATLHPFGILYALLSPLQASRLEGALGPSLAGIGMLAYLHRIGCGRVGSLVGALSFGLGGFVAAHATHPTFVRTALAIPWALLAIEALDGPRLIGALALCVGFGGHPQGIVYGFGLVFLYGLFVGRPLASGRLLPLVAGFALGGGLAACVWLPALELAASSTRALGGPLFPDPRMGTVDWFRLVVPLAGGGGVGPLSRPPSNPLACSLHECSGYPGGIVWLALLAGLAPLLRDRRARFWLAAAALALFGASGELGSWVPGMRAPARMLLCWSVAVSAAVGLALRGALDHGDGGVRSPSWWLAAAGIGVVILCLVLWQPASRPAALGAAVVLGASMPCAVLWLRSDRRSSWWLAAPLALDLLVFNVSLAPVSVPREDYHRLRGTVAALGEALGELDAGEVPRALMVPITSGSNWAAVAGVPLVQGYSPLVLQSVARLLGQLNSLGAESIGLVADTSLAAPGSRVLDLLRVGLVARDPDQRSPLGNELAEAASRQEGRWRVVETRVGGGLTFYANTRAHPVAWLVRKVREVAPGQSLELVRGAVPGTDFDPTTEALVEAPSGAWAELPMAMTGERCEPSSVRVEHFAEDTIRLSVCSPGDALLVTSEVAYPGWTATVDGRDTEVHSVNAGFRAVRVAGGSHDVVFRYRPMTAYVGLAVSGLSFAGVLACLLCPRRTRPRPRAVAPRTGALLAIVLALTACGEPEPSPPRDVVLIVVDTLRADRLSAYGYARPTSATLEPWLERARLFEHCFATSSWTLPSFVSIFTGRLPSRATDVEGGKLRVLDPSVPMLAERFRAAGYATGAIVSNGFLAPAFGFDRGFDGYDWEAGGELEFPRAERVVDRALSWLDDAAGTPRFLVVHLLDPHMAYDPPAPHRGTWSSSFDSKLELPVVGVRKLRRPDAGLAPVDRRFISAAYDEELAYVAAQMSRLLAGLDERGVLEAGLVVLTSDHGEELFEHGRFEHGHAMWQELLHVPLVFWGRGVHPGRVASPVSIVDITPTLIEAVGLETSNDLDGRSIWPEVTGRSTAAAPALFAEGILYGPPARVIVRWPHKLVLHVATGRVELFDLVADPYEQRDLSDSDAERREALLGELRARIAGGATSRVTRPAAELDESTRERLRSLGYID